MGTWDIGAFDNDRTLDTLARLKDVNGPGVNAFLWTALDSRFKEVEFLAIALIDIIYNDREKELEPCLTTTMIKEYVLAPSTEVDDKLRREAYQRVCYLIEKGNDSNWKDWDAREKELLRLKKSLEK